MGATSTTRSFRLHSINSPTRWPHFAPQWVPSPSTALRSCCGWFPVPSGRSRTSRLLGAGYFDVDNGMTTTEGGAPNVIASQRGIEGGRLALVLRGSVPAGISGVGYRRRIENPLTHAAFVMAEALQRAGIRGGRRVRVGTGPSGLPASRVASIGPAFAAALPGRQEQRQLRRRDGAQGAGCRAASTG